jgi:hypothetical protein
LREKATLSFYCLCFSRFPCSARSSSWQRYVRERLELQEAKIEAGKKEVEQEVYCVLIQIKYFVT